ncbi:hypothetical protein TNCV_2226941 [Trichonephila clavipes]|uniref:Uncharacterized protein n=1 Tax=Trichonephila clavipes TaxID=2585209 RepID=A0A8X7BJH0_TRICX|nr:hypothetical protein TNCV_2226941 [Trichonephila clavipes]
MADLTYAEKSNMHYIYARANDNGRAALRMYQVQFDHRIFSDVHTNLNATFGPPDNALSVDFSQRANNLRLIEDETFDDSDIINNLIDYEETDIKNRILQKWIKYMQ